MIFNRGFSLVEVLIGLSIVMLSGFGTLKMYAYIEVARVNSELWVEALHIADAQMALMKQINTDNRSCHSQPITFDNVQNCHLSLNPESVFKLETDIEKTVRFFDDAGGTSEVYAKIIHIKVMWRDRNGIEQGLNMPVSVTKSTNLFN